MTQVPLAEGVFTWPSDDPRLIATSCTVCGTTTFPTQSSCPKCASDQMEQVLLEPRGTLWTFTTQEFRPKEPYKGPEPLDSDWQPYGVGYIEIPENDIKVEARLTESDSSKLRIGMDMELRIIPFGTDDEGNEIVNYAFAPVGADS
jgi:uncharacterized OB-fold protein